MPKKPAKNKGEENPEEEKETSASKLLKDLLKLENELVSLKAENSSISENISKSTQQQYENTEKLNSAQNLTKALQDKVKIDEESVIKLTEKKKDSISDILVSTTKQSEEGKLIKETSSATATTNKNLLDSTSKRSKKLEDDVKTTKKISEVEETINKKVKNSSDSSKSDKAEKNTKAKKEELSISEKLSKKEEESLNVQELITNARERYQKRLNAIKSGKSEEKPVKAKEEKAVETQPEQENPQPKKSEKNTESLKQELKLYRDIKNVSDKITQSLQASSNQLTKIVNSRTKELNLVKQILTESAKIKASAPQVQKMSPLSSKKPATSPVSKTLAPKSESALPPVVKKVAPTIPPPPQSIKKAVALPPVKKETEEKSTKQTQEKQSVIKEETLVLNTQDSILKRSEDHLKKKIEFFKKEENVFKRIEADTKKKEQLFKKEEPVIKRIELDTKKKELLSSKSEKTSKTTTVKESKSVAKTLPSLPPPIKKVAVPQQPIKKPTALVPPPPIKKVAVPQQPIKKPTALVPPPAPVKKMASTKTAFDTKSTEKESSIIEKIGSQISKIVNSVRKKSEFINLIIEGLSEEFDISKKIEDKTFESFDTSKKTINSQESINKAKKEGLSISEKTVAKESEKPKASQPKQEKSVVEKALPKAVEKPAKPESIAKKVEPKEVQLPKKSKTPAPEAKSKAPEVKTEASKIVEENVSKTSIAQKELNSEIEKSIQTETQFVNMSSSYIAQQKAKISSQKELNESKKEELSIIKQTSLEAKKASDVSTSKKSEKTVVKKAEKSVTNKAETTKKASESSTSKKQIVAIENQKSIDKKIESNISNKESINKKLESSTNKESSINKKVETGINKKETVEKKLESSVNKQSSLDKKFESSINKQKDTYKKVEDNINKQSSVDKKIESSTNKQRDAHKKAEENVNKQSSLDKKFESSINKQKDTYKKVEDTINKQSSIEKKTESVTKKSTQSKETKKTESITPKIAPVPKVTQSIVPASPASPTVKKPTEKKKPVAKVEKDVVMKNAAPKMVPAPETISKTAQAQKEVNNQMEKGNVVNEEFLNVSSARVKQIIKEREQQEALKKSQEDTLSIHKKITEEKSKKTSKKESSESITKSAKPPKERKEKPETVAKAAGAAPPPPPPKGPTPPKDKSTVSGPGDPDPKSWEATLQAARGIQEAAKMAMDYEGQSSIVQKENIKLLDKAIQTREGIESSIAASVEDGEMLADLEKLMHKTAQQRVFAQARLKQLEEDMGPDAQEALKKQEEISKAIQSESLAQKALNEAIIEGRDLTGAQAAAHEKYIKDLEKASAIASAQVIKLQKGVSLKQAEYISVSQTLKQHDKTIQALKEEEKRQSSIIEKMGVFGKSMQVVGGILDHYGVGKFMKINEAIDAMQKKAAEGANKWQVALAGVGSIMKTFGDMLKDPVGQITSIVGLLTFVVKKATEYQSRSFETAKALGMTVFQAEKLRGTYEQIANKNGQLALTAKEMLETQGKLNEALGMMAPSTEEFATQSTLIMRRFGASAESMTELQLTAAKNGKTMRDTFATVVGTGKARAYELKMAMSEKQILDEISKVSSTVYMNFKGNVKELASAVVEAKKMGLSLDKIDKIGDSLLDFESSMTKEMEAQLLTGKDINLSKARELALAGDTGGLMKELNKQIGSQAQYEKMNVIQRQAYADALGMSRQEMDEMYRQQEKAKVLGELAHQSEVEQYNALVKRGMKHDEIAKIMGAEATRSAESASVNEKMAATMERINEAIGKAMQQFMPLIEKVANWLSDTKNIESVINNIVTTAKVLASVYVGIKATKAAMWLMEKGSLLTQRAKNMAVKQEGVADKANLATEKKGNIVDGQRVSKKKMKKMLAQQESTTEKISLATNQVGKTVDQTRLGLSKQNLATSAASGAKEKVNTGFSIVNAIAKVTGAGGLIGPILGGIAATMLFGYLSQVGGGGGGESGGSAGGGMQALPAIKEAAEEIKPMNQAAETQKTVNTALVSTKKDVERGQGTTNVTVVNNIDPITGKSLSKVVNNDPSTYAESSKIAANVRKS
jgi:hypothetical protein